MALLPSSRPVDLRPEPIDDGELTRLVLMMLEDGPTPVSRLAAQLDEMGYLAFLRAEGADVAAFEEVVEELLMENEDTWWTSDGIAVLTAHLTNGLVLTHRMTARELELGVVCVVPDLIALDLNARDGLELAGGGQMTYVHGAPVPGDDQSTFVGPLGWLESFEPGDMVAFRRTGRSVSVERADAPAVDDDEVQLLHGTIDDRIPPRGCEEAFPLVCDALTRSQAAFRRPVRPLGELLQAAGLERRGFSFGRAGEDWSSVGEQHRDHLLARLAGKWHFDACCTDMASTVLRAFDVWCIETDAGSDDPRAIAEALSHGTVGPAFADSVLGPVVGGDERLASFAGHLIASVPRSYSAPAHLLLALDAERRGDAVAAEAELRTAVHVDPGYGPAALELAIYEIDRSDIGQAIRRFRHPDTEPELEVLEYLEKLRARIDVLYRGVGRNDPCPCASGRKFKACCQRAGLEVPLEQRVGLLGRKLDMFVHRDHRRPRLLGVASSACDSEADDLLSRLTAMARSPVIADFVLFEGGVAQEYLDERGELLPQDERDLLAELVEEPRRLWEVTELAADGPVMLRAVDDGEACEVTAVAAGDAGVGDLLLARRLPIDEAEVSFFGIPLVVSPGLREAALGLIETVPDADGLADLFGRMLAEVADADE